MRFSTSCISAVVLAGGALAAAPSQECFTNHASNVAELSDCGSRDTLTACLAQLEGIQHTQVQACYAQAGCSDAEAAREARYAIDRCRDVAGLLDLKKRYGVMNQRDDAAITSKPSLGAECLDIKVIDTTQCVIETDKGRLKTATCTPAQATTSSCKAHLLCQLDPSGATICMEVQNGLDIGGIIVAIIFGASIVIGIAVLTFLCCKDSREQKRLNAKAEATAVARAATQKKRNQDARAPLMRQQEPAGDPFHDSNQS